MPSRRLPLWIAFILARRPATRRYTYGYERAEDLAALVADGVEARTDGFTSLAVVLGVIGV